MVFIAHDAERMPETVFLGQNSHFRQKKFADVGLLSDKGEGGSTLLCNIFLISGWSNSSDLVAGCFPKSEKKQSSALPTLKHSGDWWYPISGRIL